MTNFETTYNKHYRDILYISHELAKSREDAEDATAHAFIKLWEYREKVPDKNVKSFLVLCAVNKIRANAKYNKGWVDRLNEYAEIVPECIDPIGQFEETALGTAVRNAVRQLNKRPRQILELMLQGFNTNEIAARLNTTPQTIWNQRTTAYKVLRQKLITHL